MSEHGTPAVYQQHKKRGEDACDACKKANAVYASELRAKYRRRAGSERQARADAVAALIAAHQEEYAALLVSARRKS